MRSLIILVTAGLVLGGCEPSGEDAREVQAAREQTAVERRQREQAEIRLREEELRTSRWHAVAALAVGGVVCALIIGAILGSRARHDAGA